MEPKGNTEGSLKIKVHNINYLELKKLHEIEGFTFKELSFYYNCNISTIKKISKRHEIKSIRGISKVRDKIIKKSKINLFAEKETDIKNAELFLKNEFNIDDLNIISYVYLFLKIGRIENDKVILSFENKDMNKIKRCFYFILKMPCYVIKNDLYLTKKSSVNFLFLIYPYANFYFNSPVETLKTEKSVSKEE